ncbi:MAG: phenylacetic acid degradation protein PaaN [Myxococcota bacterium]
MSGYFERHRDWLAGALDANQTRGHWTPFVESPSRKLHPDGARDRGEAAFKARLNRDFELDLPGTNGAAGAEVSPYTAEPLGIRYPTVDAPALFDAMEAAQPRFAEARPAERVGVCLEMLARWNATVFENAYATMHTAGQSFMMAFAGSGANSLDRGLEALAWAHHAMSAIPEHAVFERTFGRTPVRLDKRYRLHPRGIAVVFSCGTYPAWNAYPAVLANLATGNPVTVKPHPGCILPMARMVEIGRDVLADAGFDPNVLTLAVDRSDRLVGKELLGEPRTAIVDFTGGAGFGGWIEENCRRLLVYTETAGCNSVVLESADRLAPVLRAIAHSLCIFSSQMCTAAQNIFVPASGVRTSSGIVAYEEVLEALAQEVDALTENAAPAAALCGAIMSEQTLRDIERFEAQADRLLRPSGTFAHPDFPNARTRTPAIAAVDAAETTYRREFFGPMAFAIRCDSRDHALKRATEDAKNHGAIASYAYTVDEAFEDAVVQAHSRAGASVGVNLIGQLPINYTAAYSDFHVTGLNPAGTACLADPAFVASRFRITQSKIERAR